MPKIHKNVANIEKTLQYLTNKEAELLGFEKAGNDIPAYVYLKYYDNKYQCFSEWSVEELKQFSGFVEKWRSTTWTNIYKSGASSGNKAGLGYTICKNTKLLPNQSIVNLLSPDITFFELRASNEARVHGFRSRSAFCLIWLDRNHEVYS